MKIGIEATRANLKGRGIDRHTYCLINALNQIDKTNEYILFTNNINAKEDLNLGSNFKIESLNRRFRMIRRSYISFLGKMFFRDLDLFHFPNSDIWYAKYCKTIVTLHDLAPLHFPDFFFNSPRKFNNYKRHLAYIRKNADFILTVSRYSKKDIAEKLSYPADRIFRIYNGVDSKFKKLETNSNQVEFTKRKFDLPEKFILFVGGLDFRKNIATLIKAFKLVQEKTMFKEHKLVIAGNNLVRNNKFYPPLEKISQDLFMDKQVIFLRAFNDEDLVALYNLAMLFVFPSTFEGFGFPPLEAMACGCPVLCSNRCSLPEVVNDAAVLFEPEDTLHLANLMQELLLSSQLLSDLAKKGIERAKFFSWEKAAQETIAVYKELAA